MQIQGNGRRGNHRRSKAIKIIIFLFEECGDLRARIKDLRLVGHTTRPHSQPCATRVAWNLNSKEFAYFTNMAMSHENIALRIERRVKLDFPGEPY